MRCYPVNMTTMNEVFAEALRRKIVPHPRGAEDTKRQAAILRRVSYACPPECLPALAETVGHLEAGRTTTEVSTGRMLADELAAYTEATVDLRALPELAQDGIRALSGDMPEAMAMLVTQRVPVSWLRWVDRLMEAGIYSYLGDI